MRFDVVTLFPELFAPFLESGVTRRAYEQKLVDVRLWNLRDFASGSAIMTMPGPPPKGLSSTRR